MQRIQQLEQRVDSLSPGPAAAATPSTVASPTASNTTEPGLAQPVGEAPKDVDRPPEVAVLGEQGALITRRGQLTGELLLGYTRADRNRALFRGIALLDTLLIGIFDINESHQDVLEATPGFRYGLTDRLEIGAKLPLIHRSDSSVLAPIRPFADGSADGTIASSARGNGIGDVEASLRYQVTRGGGGWPFLVANLQVNAPTGESPFAVPRDDLGRELRAATGAGFWSVAPSMTAILPTDPAVLFGSLGYAHNFGRSVDTLIAPVRITHVDPGDSVSATAGIGIGLNERATINFGYTHNWTFGTRTTTVSTAPNSTATPVTTKTRDLQLGRFLFGVTYRVTDDASLNWGVEIGATRDAPDVRTTLRIPVTLIPGR
ncbi:hypothetical protein [Sphingomonas ginkgonis]|nr:hypothetical protein [Sphingomonas ginkgonis]